MSSTTPIPAPTTPWPPARARLFHRSSQRAEAFTYGRVSFEILTDERSGPPGISEELLPSLVAGRAAHAAAHVVCSVKADPWLRSDETRPVVWTGDRADVVAGGVRGALTRLSPGVYVASCRIAASVEDVGPLLDALSAAVLADDLTAP